MQICQPTKACAHAPQSAPHATLLPRQGPSRAHEARCRRAPVAACTCGWQAHALPHILPHALVLALLPNLSLRALADALCMRCMQRAVGVPVDCSYAAQPPATPSCITLNQDCYLLRLYIGNLSFVPRMQATAYRLKTPADRCSTSNSRSRLHASALYPPSASASRQLARLMRTHWKNEAHRGGGCRRAPRSAPQSPRCPAAGRR